MPFSRNSYDTQREHAADEIGDVLRRTRGRLPAREREQVADDACGALGLLGDAPQVATRARRRSVRGSSADACRSSSSTQLRVADDARQRVVQLVRDAGDELTDRRQLLGLEQLRLRRLQPLDASPAAGRWSTASSSLICCSRRALWISS